MNKFALSLPAILLTSAAPVLAQNDQISITPPPVWVAASEPLEVPEDADGTFFLRKLDTIIHLDEGGETLFQDQMYRVLRPQALQLGNVAVTWNPASGEPAVHSLRIHRNGTVIDVLEDTEFEILRREDQLETAMLDGLLTAVLRVPDLRVGDDLEFSFSVPSHDPTFAETNYGFLSLAHAPPSGNIRLVLSWDEGQKPTTRMTPEFETVAIRNDQSIELAFENAEAVSPPQDAPPRYNWMRVLEYSDFASWSDMSRQIAPLFDAASELRPDSKLREEARQISAMHSTDFARAAEALELVQQNVRYIYVGLNGGNLTPASADETWERRYGDCKGKTTMLLALLNEMGITAEAVLVNNGGTDDGMDERLPTPGLFDHVLVRAIIDGKTYWLDGTMPDVVSLRDHPILPYRWALPLSAKGDRLEAVPQTNPDLPLEMGIEEIDARAGFDQPAVRSRTIVTRGIAGVQEYQRFSSVSSNQLRSTLTNALISGGQWHSIEDITYSYDRETEASILKIRGIGPVDWDDEGSGAFDLILPGGGFSPPPRRQRPPNQDQTAPFYAQPTYSCYVTTVRLPEGTEAENWGFNSTFDTMLFGRAYYRMMEKGEDGSIRMVRGAKVIDPLLPSKRVKRDNDRLADFDNSMARINYDPGRTFESWGDLRKVPASYELDWTGSKVPCLPPDLLEID